MSAKDSLECGNICSALVQRHEASELNAADVNFGIGQGNTYKAQGKDAQAIGLDTENALPDPNLGNGYKRLEKYSLEKYSKVTDSKSIYAQAYKIQGIGHKGESQYELAISAYEKVLEIDPDSTSAYRNLCALHILIDQPETALPYCEKAGQ